MCCAYVHASSAYRDTRPHNHERRSATRSLDVMQGRFVRGGGRGEVFVKISISLPISSHHARHHLNTTDSIDNHHRNFTPSHAPHTQKNHVASTSNTHKLVNCIDVTVPVHQSIRLTLQSPRGILNRPYQRHTESRLDTIICHVPSPGPLRHAEKIGSVHTETRAQNTFPPACLGIVSLFVIRHAPRK